MEIKTNTHAQNISPVENDQSQKTKNLKNFSNPGFAAKNLADKHQLDMYFSPRPNVSFCNHAVAVVAATAAIVAAVNGAIEASKKGRTVDTVQPLHLKNTNVAGLDINSLLEIRKTKL